MSPDTLRAMLKALPDVTEEGDTVRFDAGWEVTVHAGRGAGGFSVQHVEAVTLHAEFVVLETAKRQRFVLVLEDLRGFAAEPSTTDRRGRKAGFV